MSTLRRREFLLEPGEQLLLTTSAIGLMERFDEFNAHSGLAPEAILSDPLCATPLPVFELDADGTLARPATANPAFMWHPLMWLPATTALRYRLNITEDGGETRVEDDHEWAIRVALELQSSPLYDVETGTWLDILALHGLDSDLPEVQGRIAAWLAGADDPILDTVNLDGILFPTGDHDWSIGAAQELARVLIPAQWCYTAQSLLDSLEQSLSEAVDLEHARRIGSIITTLADALLGDVPGIDGDELTADRVERIQVALADPASTIEEPVAELQQLLVGIRDDYAIAAETIETAGERLEAALA